MICSYCKTETQNQDTCDFCKADLNRNRPKLNPELDESEAEYSQPQLLELHTYDLMLLLRHIRAERTEMYKIMQNVRKAPDEAKSDDYDTLNEYGQENYRALTARKNVIEQILVDRMGYIPQRVDNKLLEALKRKIERCKS